MAERIEMHTAGEWTAVYLDGKLIQVGDTYHAEEWLRQHVGVVDVYDDAFMRGQESAEGVAKTLDEVTEYARSRQERRDRATSLRAEAARLEAEAKLLAAEDGR